LVEQREITHKIGHWTGLIHAGKNIPTAAVAEDLQAQFYFPKRFHFQKCSRAELYFICKSRFAKLFTTSVS